MATYTVSDEFLLPALLKRRAFAQAISQLQIDVLRPFERSKIEQCPPLSAGVDVASAFPKHILPLS